MPVQRLASVVVAAALLVAGLTGVASSQGGKPSCKDQKPRKPAPGLAKGARTVITGTTGPDVLVGTPGPDTITGKGGDDLICGFDGDDRISPGRGDDVVDAGDGKDGVKDGRADDFGSGDDVVSGGSGRDGISDRTGANTLSGGPDGDSISGGDGADTINGDGGTDSLSGKGGNDTLDLGEPGTTRGRTKDGAMNGGPGFDVCLGGDPARRPSIKNCETRTRPKPAPPATTPTTGTPTTTPAAAAPALVRTVHFHPPELPYSFACAVVNGPAGTTFSVQAEGPGVAGTPAQKPGTFTGAEQLVAFRVNAAGTVTFTLSSGTSAAQSATHAVPHDDGSAAVRGDPSCRE